MATNCKVPDVENKLAVRLEIALTPLVAFLLATAMMPVAKAVSLLLRDRCPSVERPPP